MAVEVDKMTAEVNEAIDKSFVGENKADPESAAKLKAMVADLMKMTEKLNKAIDASFVKEN